MQNKRPQTNRFQYWPNWPNWRNWLLAGATISLVVALYAFQLGSFISLSPAEAATAAANQSLRAVAADPLNLPYKLLDSVFLHLPFGPLELRARAASIVLALGCSLLFYFIVRRWHGGTSAFLALLVFASSGWLLQTGRFGSGLIMLTFMVLAMIAAAVWINSSEPQPDGRPFLLYVFACCAALFVPAGLWFVLAATLVFRKKLLEHAREAGRLQLMAAGLLVIIALTSLAFAMVRQPDQAQQWIGLPLAYPEYIVMAKQAAASLAYLIARGPYLPEVWLAHTPVLDVASSVLLLLGAVFYARHWSNCRVKLLITFTLLGIVLITLHGAYALAYLVPIAYLVVATGLTYLIRQWYRVFPRNPFAHGLAVIALTGMLLAIGAYHTQRYFVAWRNNPDTAEAYRQAGSQPVAPGLIQ